MLTNAVTLTPQGPAMVEAVGVAGAEDQRRALTSATSGLVRPQLPDTGMVEIQIENGGIRELDDLMYGTDGSE